MGKLYSFLGSLISILTTLAVVAGEDPIKLFNSWLIHLGIPNGWMVHVYDVLGNGSPWGIIGVVLALIGAMGTTWHGIGNGRSAPTFWFGAFLMTVSGHGFWKIFLILVIGYIIGAALGESSSDQGGKIGYLYRLSRMMSIPLTWFAAPLGVIAWLTAGDKANAPQQISNPYNQPLLVEIKQPKANDPLDAPLSPRPPRYSNDES